MPIKNDIFFTDSNYRCIMPFILLWEPAAALIKLILTKLCHSREQAIAVPVEWLHRSVVPFCESRIISAATETQAPLIWEDSTHMGNRWQHNSGERNIRRRTLGQSSPLSRLVRRSVISLQSSQAPGSLDLLSKTSQPASYNEFSGCYWEMKRANSFLQGCKLMGLGSQCLLFCLQSYLVALVEKCGLCWKTE